MGYQRRVHGITPSHDLNLPQSTAYQTHFKQLNLKSIIMSDAARKGFGEQAQEKLTPQSQKSTGQVIGENLTGAGDKVAAAVQPSSEKSTTQKAGDSVRGSGDSAQLHHWPDQGHRQEERLVDFPTVTLLRPSHMDDGQDLVTLLAFWYLMHGSSLLSLAVGYCYG